MAKKLIQRYTFDPASNSVTVEGIYKLERFLLITNTTTNENIFTFNSSTKGVASYSTTESPETTTLVLDYDCSAMNSSDSLQIFVELDYTYFEPSESFVDPVNKLRVTNPQNLIDTDFEYGLQTSKWETVELVNSVPGFYANQTDYIIPDVISVQTTEGSENVTVTTREAHGISIGAPIDVQGLGIRTAEGKFLVTKVPSATTFVYKASGVQSQTRNVVTVYTTITPGQFYGGSTVNYRIDNGITSDNAQESSLTIETDYVHGFKSNTSLYITNTIGKQIYNVSNTTSSTAPDGRPYVDFDDTLTANLAINTALTETKQLTGTYAHKFSSTDVDTGANTIAWPNHNLKPGDALLYVPSAGDTHVGGLERFQVYFVKTTPNNNTITLCAVTNGDYTNNPVISLTSGGTSTYGRHQLILGYEIQYIYKINRGLFSEFRTTFNQTGSGSGWDLVDRGQTTSNGIAGYYGLGAQRPTHYQIISSVNFSTLFLNYTGSFPYYSTNVNANFTLAKSGTTPDGYDFIEDWERFSSYTYMSGIGTNNHNHNTAGVNLYNVGYRFSAHNSSVTGGTTFFFGLIEDPEADSFYVENHGLDTGAQVTFDTTSGANIIARTETNPLFNTAPTLTDKGDPLVSTITVISSNRFKLDEALRVNSAAGAYNVSAIIDNPTRDSIYIGEYDIIEGEKVFIKPGVGGELPTTSNGAVVAQQTGTLKTIYDVTTSTLDTVKTTMGSDSGLFLYNNNSEYYPFVATNVLFDSGRQYFFAQRTGVTFYSPVYGSLTQSLSSLTNWATGQEVELFQGTTLANKGYSIITTPFSFNDTVPYHIDILQTPYDSSIVNASSYSRMYFTGSSRQYFTTNQLQDNNNFYTNWTSLSDGWRYTFDTMYAAPSATYHGFMSILITIDNSSWPGYYNNYNGSGGQLGTSNRSFLQSEYSSAAGQRYTVHAYVPIKAGSTTSNYGTTTGSVISAQTIAQTIASNIATSLTYPVLTTNATNEVYVREVSGNRIGIKSSAGISYDFVDSGNAAIIIESEEKTGGVDGYYNISSTTDYNIICDTTREIPTRILDFTANSVSTIDGTDYITIQSHKLRTGQEITFISNGGTIDELSNGQVYYAYAPGPDEIAISSSLLNATSGNTLTLSNANGSMHFETSSISGISPGDGTVTFSSTSNKIIGTDTSFRRYYKPNDKILLRDVTVTPEQYVELDVVSVLDDSELTVDQSVGIDNANGTNYYVETQVHVRPDGSTLHRPFDGGVEINAGTSPNSSIVRQTRKYFRYQSGKGIQVSLAINFNPSRLALTTEATANTATITTEYPHGITVGDSVTIKGSNDQVYNGTFEITAADQFTFSYDLGVTPTLSVPSGLISYNISGWVDSYVRCGLFDYQNGMFFEYDGQDLYAVRRSSVQQLPGTVGISYGSNILIGENTKFNGQLTDGDFIVIRGMSHKVTRVVSDTELHIQPSYRGITASNIVVTKTVDTKVKQSEWNLDVADGSGPSGFNLDITKIQMAYIDYSWYGAGKVRFGFKDTYGHVTYCHEFIHNNRLEEAYMRSGNIPARYEIYNDNNPTYVPGLFHWGTSVIMDGRFDDDKAYQFTAPSNSLSFTNGDTDTSTTNANSQLVPFWAGNNQYDWYVRLSFPAADGGLFSTGTPLYTAGGELDGEQVAFTDYSGSSVRVYIFIRRSRNTPTVYPVVSNATAVNVGAPASGGSDADLTDLIPLISIRLAPSVDNNISGALGARDIINRMQLQLKSTGITLSHDCDAYLILNGSIDNKTYEVVGSPSLSQLIKHVAGDRIIGGSEIFSFRASGGTTDTTGKRLNVTSEFDLSQITDLGNSILGGDGVFPNGPDLLTIAVKPVDTSQINSVSPLQVYGRITWTESQA